MQADKTEAAKAPETTPSAKEQASPGGSPGGSAIKSALKGHDFAEQEKMLAPPDAKPPSE